MDPVTAALNAAAALFNFLASAEGQKVVEDFRTLDQGFVQKMKDLFDKVHAQAAK